MTDPDQTRVMNHSRTPLVRSQIRGLRLSAQYASDKAAAVNGGEIGLALNANMLAGFALELGLKLFYLSYYNHNVRGHSLEKLFSGLPEKMKNDISLEYSSRLKSTPLIQAYAFSLSTEAPDLPNSSLGRKYTNANELFASASGLFVKARYLFEEVGTVDWLVVDEPTHYLLTMSEALDAVYDSYMQRGGWN